MNLNTNEKLKEATPHHAGKWTWRGAASPRSVFARLSLVQHLRYIF